MNASTRPRLLLHVCCAPCATHCIEVLQPRYGVTLFFANSNIAPHAEFAQRLEHARRLVALYRVPLIEDACDHAAWQCAVAGLETEPERGRRCAACIAFNLERTARYARCNRFDAFTTTLTISPHKDARQIFEIGARFGPFLSIDFKQNGGFAHSVALSKHYGLYRQDYCGCEFSQRT